jgi:hypothetical protein
MKQFLPLWPCFLIEACITTGSEFFKHLNIPKFFSLFYVHSIFFAHTFKPIRISSRSKLERYDFGSKGNKNNKDKKYLATPS